MRSGPTVPQPSEQRGLAGRSHRDRLHPPAQAQGQVDADRNRKGQCSQVFDPCQDRACIRLSQRPVRPVDPHHRHQACRGQTAPSIWPTTSTVWSSTKSEWSRHGSGCNTDKRPCWPLQTVKPSTKSAQTLNSTRHHGTIGFIDGNMVVLPTHDNHR